MQIDLNSNLENQIQEASRRAKCKKALYLYDETGNRELIGVFSKVGATQVRAVLRSKNLIHRLTEFDVRTTEPDSPYPFA